MKKNQRMSLLVILSLAMVMSFAIPVNADVASFFGDLGQMRDVYLRDPIILSLEDLSNGNRAAAITKIGAALDNQGEVLDLITTGVMAAEIDSKTAKSLSGAVNKDFAALAKSSTALNDPKKSLDKVLGELKKAQQAVAKTDATIAKTAAKLGAGIVTLAQTPPSAGFHNPGDRIDYVISGLPPNCCANNCVTVELVSTAYGLGYTPVEPTIIGDPCTGKFSVIMGPNQGGAFVVVNVNGVEYKRGLYNYGDKPGGKTTTADYQGCYTGTAWGSITVQTPEGPVTVGASASVDFCLDAKGQGTVFTEYDSLYADGPASGAIKISSGGGASFKVGGNIGVPGASVSWTGSFILARDGVAYGSGTWSISIPGIGGGGGGWSITRSLIP